MALQKLHLERLEEGLKTMLELQGIEYEDTLRASDRATCGSRSHLVFLQEWMQETATGSSREKDCSRLHLPKRFTSRPDAGPVLKEAAEGSSVLSKEAAEGSSVLSSEEAPKTTDQDCRVSR